MVQQGGMRTVLVGNGGSTEFSSSSVGERGGKSKNENAASRSH